MSLPRDSSGKKDPEHPGPQGSGEAGLSSAGGREADPGVGEGSSESQKRLRESKEHVAADWLCHLLWCEEGTQKKGLGRGPGAACISNFVDGMKDNAKS